jgi:hypothetical protein
VPSLVVGDGQPAPGVVVGTGARVVAAANDPGAGRHSSPRVTRPKRLFLWAAAAAVLAAAATVLVTGVAGTVLGTTAARCVLAAVTAAAVVGITTAASRGCLSGSGKRAWWDSGCRRLLRH